MSRYPEVGARARFAKTVTETDVTLFAGITGDLAPQHVDADYMSKHPAGQRVAPESARGFNPAFDVTPHDLIDAVVTERGVVEPSRHPAPGLMEPFAG